MSVIFNLRDPKLLALVHLFSICDVSTEQSAVCGIQRTIYYKYFWHLNISLLLIAVSSHWRLITEAADYSPGANFSIKFSLTLGLIIWRCYWNEKWGINIINMRNTNEQRLSSHGRNTIQSSDVQNPNALLLCCIIWLVCQSNALKTPWRKRQCNVGDVHQYQ